LWEAFFGGCCGTVFLEVRESNKAARNLYLSLGFQELGRRPEYYETPLEPAIVMKFHSC
jgi:ribosomal protein S18 acetylase RimI-like enzyme